MCLDLTPRAQLTQLAQPAQLVVPMRRAQLAQLTQLAQLVVPTPRAQLV